SPVELTGGWTNLSSSESWTSLDVNADPSSGSVRIDNTAPDAGTIVPMFSVCMNVVPGETYAFSAWQFTPSPPLAAGSARLYLQWRESCPDGAFMGASPVPADSAAEGVWTLVSGEAQAPVGATGAHLWLSVVKTPGASERSTYFDDLFVPEPGAAPA